MESLQAVQEKNGGRNNTPTTRRREEVHIPQSDMRILSYGQETTNTNRTAKRARSPNTKQPQSATKSIDGKFNPPMHTGPFFKAVQTPPWIPKLGQVHVTDPASHCPRKQRWKCKFLQSENIFVKQQSQFAESGARKRRGKPRLDQHIRSNCKARERNPDWAKWGSKIRALEQAVLRWRMDIPAEQSPSWCSGLAYMFLILKRHCVSCMGCLIFSTDFTGSLPNWKRECRSSYTSSTWTWAKRFGGKSFKSKVLFNWFRPSHQRAQVLRQFLWLPNGKVSSYNLEDFFYGVETFP